MTYTNEMIGGFLIGLGSLLPLIFFGRIAGISGYAASLFPQQGASSRSALVFILGMLLTGALWLFFNGSGMSYALPRHPLALWIFAGLLVGFGSRLGGGCTSGHGVCGMGRLSVRSFASVIVFILTAILLVFLRKVLS